MNDPAEEIAWCWSALSLAEFSLSCWRLPEEDPSDAKWLPRMFCRQACSSTLCQLPQAASQLIVSFPMTPVLMDINSWLCGNGWWRVNHSVSFETSQLLRNRFASRRSTCCSDVSNVNPQNSSKLRFSSVQEGMPSTHRLNTLSVSPRPRVMPPDVFHCSHQHLLYGHVTPHLRPWFRTTYDGEASRWREFLELILCHLIIQVRHLLEVEVSIFCVC